MQTLTKRQISLISGGKDVLHTLNTLRLKLFAKAGYIGIEGEKTCFDWRSPCVNASGSKASGTNQNVTFSPVFTP